MLQGSNKSFEQIWSIWLSCLSGISLLIGASLALWIKSGQSGIESLQEGVRDSLLGHYNDITHGGLIIVLLILAGILIQAILQSPSEDVKTKHQKSWLSKSLGFIKEYPVVTIILAAYVTLMIQESSWFYKDRKLKII